MKILCEKSTHRFALITAITAGLVACGSAPDWTNNRRVDITSVKTNKVAFSDLYASYSESGLVVKGKLARLPSTLPLLFGHIDIRSLDKNNRPVSSRTIGFWNYGRTAGMVKKYQFYTTIKMEAEKIASVQVRYHNEPDTPH